MKKERNYNIDFLRGIAVLCIVLIHTVWWSGTSYLPSEFSNICLLIDVPVFIFISGMSFNYINSITKSLKGIINQWKKWIYFLLIYIILIIVLYNGSINLKDIFSWITYTFPTNTSIPVVPGSIWFMVMYIKVALFCSIIICAINYFSKEKKEQDLILLLVTMLMIFIYTSTAGNFLFFDEYLSFYSLIFVLGYILCNYKIKGLKQFALYELSALTMTFITFKIYGFGINEIQVAKFPPSIPYLPFSMISIAFFWYLKDKLKIGVNNKINYIGQNAIFFYFSQGVSSSFLYFFQNHITTNSNILMFIVLFGINITCTIIGAYLLEKSYTYILKILKKSNVKKFFIPEKTK